MAGSTKESEDLVALLSRPNPSGGGGGGGGLKRSSIGVSTESEGGSSTQDGGSAQNNLENPSPGGVGRSTFFELKRPSSENTMNTAAGMEDMDAPSSPSHGVSFGGNNNNNTSCPPTSSQPQRPLPSLRSALRMGSRTDMKAMSSSVSTNQMRKNTSVTFANATKKPSQMGINEGLAANPPAAPQGNARFSFPDTDGGGQQQRVGFQQVAQMRQFAPQLQSADYSAQSMMKKSQSIAAPQFMLAHQNSNMSGASANESFGSQGPDGGAGGNSSTAAGEEGAEANSSFPIYFADLPTTEGKQRQQQAQQQQQQPPNNKRRSPFEQARLRSKSTNTMQYYAKNTMQSDVAKDPAQKLLHAAGTARPSMNGLNLTFRDMLDEGDGAENDLNLRSRNQQWKHFRSFSNKFESDNPMMQAARMEMDQDNTVGATNPIKEGGSFGSMGTTDTEGTHLSESKRTLTPSSYNSRNGNPPSSGGASGNKAFSNGGGMLPPRSLAGSHRAVVSVNDLAVLRRAAARMKMNPASNMQNSASSRQPSQRLPGEMLGGGMLSRIPSSSNSTVSSGGDTEGNDDALSPLAQMMAKMNGNRAAGNGTNSGGSSSEQQKELFLQMLSKPRAGAGNPGLSSRASSNNMGMGGMGRRAQTVGAGLAFDRGNTTMGNNGFRLSRFNLGGMSKETSQLSLISSGGESGGGRNEEW